MAEVTNPSTENADALGLGSSCPHACGASLAQQR
jgi:hypothetical protein